MITKEINLFFCSRCGTVRVLDWKFEHNQHQKDDYCDSCKKITAYRAVAIDWIKKQFVTRFG